MNIVKNGKNLGKRKPDKSVYSVIPYFIGIVGFLLKYDFHKFCSKVGKIPKFSPNLSKLGRNLGKSWEKKI